MHLCAHHFLESYRRLLQREYLHHRDHFEEHAEAQGIYHVSWPMALLSGARQRITRAPPFFSALSLIGAACIDAGVSAQFPGKLLLLRAAGQHHGPEAESHGVLKGEMSQSTKPVDGDEVPALAPLWACEKTLTTGLSTDGRTRHVSMQYM
jgi:hypothetical protein